MGVTLMAVALAPIVHSLAMPWTASSEEDYLILNATRDKMESVLSLDFSAIPVGSSLSDSVTIGGKSITRNVTVALYDIDGDATPEANVKKITVQVSQSQVDALKVAP